DGLERRGVDNVVGGCVARLLSVKQNAARIGPTAADDRTRSGISGGCHARSEGQKRVRISSAQRQLHDLLAGDDVAKRGILFLEQGGIRSDGNLLLNDTGLQGQVDGCGEADTEIDSRDLPRRETGLLDRERVAAVREKGKCIVSLSVG